MQSTFTDENAVINTINEVLESKVGSRKYKIWFKNSTRFELTREYMKIGVPNMFIANWLKTHFLNEITEAVEQVTRDERKVSFSIDSSLFSSRNKKNTAVSKVNTKTKKAVVKESPGRPVKYAPRKKVKLTLDTFVVGKSNELAYNTARAVATSKDSPFNPLFIHGGYGVGKTHLLQGICNEVCRRRPETNWLYLSAEDFANQFILALKTGKLEAFRRRMRQTDLLAIDDIHFLARKKSTQEEFLHTFNSIDLAGKQVVLVSDAHPKEIDELSDKLVNRFVSGMVVKIDTPDFETRYGICKQFADSSQKSIPDDVLRYVAENLKTNVRELEGAILKLIAFSSLQNSQIDTHMASQILSEHLAKADPIVQISDIEQAVADYFQVCNSDIRSSKKDRTISLARHFCMYMARKHTKMSSPEIGRFLGNKNHATVLLACKKIEEKVSKNSSIRWNGPAGNKVAKARTVLNKIEENMKN